MGYNDLILDLINRELVDNNRILQYFNRNLYGSNSDLGEFHPDVSGYTLIFLLPPHLSGYGYEEGYIPPLDKYAKGICFLAIDFTPPQIQVTASELPSRSGSLPFGMEVSPTGQVNISYVENQYNHIYGFHKLWISYVEDIIRGMKTSDSTEILPDEAYWNSSGDRFGEIDYASTAFVIRFKPTRYLTRTDINYVGKATGIFPINLPDKEIIGRRDSNELVTLSISYSCAWYRSWSAGTPGNDKDSFIYNEFSSTVGAVYNENIVFI